MKKTALILIAAFSMGACQQIDKKGTPVEKMSKAEIEKAVNDTTNFTTLVWIDSTTQQLGKLKKTRRLKSPGVLKIQGIKT